jgi:acetyl esterase/lipase
MCAYLSLGVLALALSTSGITDMKLWKSAGEPGCEIRRVSGVTYFEGARQDAGRHRLDLFVPADRKDYPVIVLVHGGAWCLGDNRCWGLYSSVGEFLAGRGIGVALPNYRLSPQVKHPEHVKDVARAVAWVHHHIAEHGGNPERIFLVGHSAGGHLVSLLATDERYLKAVGVKADIIRGVVGVSGVYRIPPGRVDATLGGSFRLDEMLGVRSTSSRNGNWLSVPISVNVFGIAFGDDPQFRADASPINHVRAGLPPFLLINAGNELPTLAEMGEEFHHVLKENGCDARRTVVPHRNHNSILFCAIQSSDPVARAIEAFVLAHGGDR